MRHLRNLVPLALVATIILSVAPASAQVAWEHTLTDPGDDVISVLEPTNKLSDWGEVDILSASVAEQGDDLNVTLTLADARDPDASYEVSITCDDDEAKDYTFTLSFGVFSISGFDLTEDNPEAYVSADLKLISWVIGKDRISASEKVEVTHAQAMVFSGITNYIDTAPDEGNGGNGGNGGGGNDEPARVQVTIEFLKLEHVRYTIETTVEGDDAKDLRAEFDMDVDGTVTKAEYDQHIGFFQLVHSSWNSTDLKLDGEGPTSRSMSFEFQGLVGSASSTSPIAQVVVLDVRFSEPEEADTHTYADFLSSVDNTGEMWHVTTDSLFTMEAPSGWKYRTDDWPAGAKTYLGTKGTTVTLSGFQMQSDWNITMGVMTSVVLTEKTEGGEEATPGLQTMTVMGAMVAIAVFLVRRRG